MKINEVFKILNEYAPIDLSNKFVEKINGYDNSGIIVDTTDDITGVIFTLDLTKNSVDLAIKNNCNLIFTHHPAIYGGVTNLKNEDALLYAIKNNIAIISFHLNLDVCKNGIDYNLAKGLGAKKQEILISLGSDVGYGRTFIVDKTLEEIVETYKQEFSSNKVMVYGNLDEKVHKMATFCGAGLDESELDLASDSDLVLSADIKHHIILKALESGKKLIEVTHYSSEVYGFNKFYESVKDKLEIFSLINIEKNYL